MCDGETLSTLAVDESRTADLSDRPNKRRSLIFQRRSIIHHVEDNIGSTCHNVQGIVDEQLQGEKSPEDEDKFDLSAYISSLRNEREEWKRILNERKSQRRRLTKQEINIGDECELDLSVLTDSERSFVLARPNYHQICKNIDNLVPLAVKVATLNTHINHLNNSLVESMEEKSLELTKRVTRLAKE